MLRPTRLTDASLLRNFKFTERAEVDKYYPQYYHKTDKVGLLTVLSL
jgi:hypothetical protein